MEIGRFAGDTHAGWRTVKARPSDWDCPVCNAHNRYYWVNCPTPQCEGRRPEED